jgi:uncharacterized protein
MSMTKRDWIEFASERIRAGQEPRAIRVRYRPAGAPLRPEPGTLEHFLIERYCLYTSDGSSILRGDAHHIPWAIQPAEAEIEENTIAPVELPPEQPLLHYAARQDALIWPLQKAG